MQHDSIFTNDRRILESFQQATLKAVEAILPLHSNLKLGFKASEIHRDGQEIVTEADTLSDLVLSNHLAEQFRNIARVTEEQKNSHLIESDTFFTIDGLDGTICFAGRYPGAEKMWGILISYIENGTPLLGSMYLRSTDQIITINQRSREIRVDGELLPRPTYPEKLTVAIDLGSWQSAHVESVIVPALRAAGVNCLVDRPSAAGVADYLLRGAAHAWVTRVARIWDVAPLAAAMPVLGGIVSPLYQEQMNWQVPYPAPAIYACTPDAAGKLKEILLALPEKDRF